jgi:hypothetical protein
MGSTQRSLDREVRIRDPAGEGIAGEPHDSVASAGEYLEVLQFGTAVSGHTPEGPRHSIAVTFGELQT